MINSYNLLLLVSLLTIITNHIAEAFTEDENFDYINKVLALLNDDVECQLPTYDGVDELQKSFRELEQVYGDSLEEKLNDDQKLVRRTLLDQWDSFQSRMTSAVVIRFSKKRSFLCKIEAYQKAKYGHSICTALKDARSSITDKIFEKNPIVRYIKHLDTGEVPEPDQANESDTDLEKEGEVIHTPISEKLPLEVNIPASKNSTQEDSSDKIDEIAQEEDTYDPLVDIPVPSAQESPDEEKEKTEVPYFEYITYTKTSTTTTEATKTEETVENEVVTEATPIETTTKMSARKFYELGYEYVDDDDDDEDLTRLNKVVPIEWNIDPIYGNFRWPDENPNDGNSMIDNGVKIEWNNFLGDPDSVELPEPEIEETNTEVASTTTETPEYIPRRLTAKDLRKKRRELLDKISVERRSREQDQLHGWSHAPERESSKEQVQKDRWVNLADNNLYNINYNRDYIGKTRPVKAIKSLFGSKGSSKKALMSRN